MIADNISYYPIDLTNHIYIIMNYSIYIIYTYDTYVDVYMYIYINMYLYIYVCIYIYSANTVVQAYHACDAAAGGPEFHAAHRTKKNVARLVGGPCSLMEL